MVDRIHKHVYQTRTEESLEFQVQFLLQSSFRINYSQDSYASSVFKQKHVENSAGANKCWYRE